MTEDDAVVSFDVDAATAAIRDALDDGPDLHVAAAFSPDAYEIVHCDEFTRSFYDDDEEMRGDFDRIHRYAGIDLSDIGQFVDELFPVTGGVEYIAIGMDHLNVVRVYTGSEGLLLTLDPDVDVTAPAEAVRDAIDPELGATGDALSAPTR